jgi:uncharacterized surface anchored protein
MRRFAFSFVALVPVLAFALAAPGLHLLAQEAAPTPVQPQPAASPAASSGADGGLTVRIFDLEREAPGTPEPGHPPFLPLAGSCVAVYRADDDARRDPVAGACSGEDGVATVRGIPEGDYVLVQTTAAPGYLPSVEAQPFSMVYGQFYTMGFENLAYGAATFQAMGETGEALPGACVAVYAASGGPRVAPAGRACDADDGANDGTTTVRYLATGEYAAVEISAPAGYAPAPEQSFTVAKGSTHDFATAHRRLPMAPATTSLEIFASTGLGEQVGGGCFLLSGPAEVGPVCDGAAEDAAPLEGQIRIDGLAAGQYTVRETTTPAGVIRAPDRVVDVVDGRVTEVDVPHATVAATPEVSAEGGRVATLFIRTVDKAGAPVPGACYQAMAAVADPDGGFIGYGACDSDDGANDGTTALPDLPGGDYILSEEPPPPGYQRGPDTAVAVGDGQTVTVTIANEAA